MVILIGPKHSGKTSVGRELARLLVVPFFDLDALIEERTGKSVRALYTAGPELFRREEEAALRVLLAGGENGSDVPPAVCGVSPAGGLTTDGVLAAGGGLTDNPGAMALLGEGHLTVYLDVSAEAAWQRITSAGELPPFLKADTMEASMEKHRVLHQRRAEACRKSARVCISAEGKGPEELAEELRGMMKRLSVSEDMAFQPASARTL